MDSSKTPQCPRCVVGLRFGRYREVDIHLCPECHGVLIRQRLLQRLLKAMSRDLVKTIDPDHPLKPLPDKGAGILCPVCGGAMCNYGYMGTNLVKIDSCPECAALWLDTKELGVMSLIYARTERRKARLEQAYAARKEESDRELDAMIAAKMSESYLSRAVRKNGMRA